MSESNTDLAAKVAELESRIAELEARLSVPRRAESNRGELSIERDGGAPPMPPESSRWLQAMNQFLDDAADAKNAPPHQAVPPPLPPPLPPTSSPPTEESVPDDVPMAVKLPDGGAASRPRPAQGTFERTVGLHWAGWAGAVVLVIGAALGVKYIYDQNWFAMVPPQVWLGMIFAAGLVLIAAGEVVYRKVNPVAAASIFGAGVATLFLAGYVGHSFYNLYTPSTALVLMVAASMIGALVAIRGNLVSIGVLSLIGGNVAPMVVGNLGAPPQALLNYLLALQAVALFLAWWGRGLKWSILRGISLAASCFWMAVRMADRSDGTRLLMTYSAIYAAFYHAELILSALRQRPPKIATLGRRGGAAFSIAVDAALTAAVMWATDGMDSHQRGLIVLAMAAGASILGFSLRYVNAALADLGVAHRIVAVALLALAIPVGMREPINLDIGWTMLAAALGVAGLMLKSPIARWSALVFWLLAACHVAATDAIAHASATSPLYYGSRFYVALGLGVLGQLLACLTARPFPQPCAARRLAQGLSKLSILLWVVMCLMNLSPLEATLMVTLYAWILLGANLLDNRLAMDRGAKALLVLLSFKWIAYDILMHVTSLYGPDHRPIFNQMMMVGLALAVSMALVAWLNRGRLSFKVLGTMAAVVFVVTGSTEIYDDMSKMASSYSNWQAIQLAWTIFWTFSFVAVYEWTRAWAGGARSLLFPLLLDLVAVKHTVIDTLPWHWGLTELKPEAPFQLELATAIVVLAALIRLYICGLHESLGAKQSIVRVWAALLAAVVGVTTITWQIDRYFGGVWTFEQVPLSIAWSAYAVGMVVIGFAVRQPALRYFGLILFAITLFKVVLLDMAHVETGLRILSFLGLGSLLLGTSVLYGAIGKKLAASATEHH